MKIKNITLIFLLIFLIFCMVYSNETRPSARDLGIKIGILKPGKINAITDVEGVLVGHEPLIIDYFKKILILFT